MQSTDHIARHARLRVRSALSALLAAVAVRGIAAPNSPASPRPADLAQCRSLLADAGQPEAVRLSALSQLAASATDASAQAALLPIYQDAEQRSNSTAVATALLSRSAVCVKAAQGTAAVIPYLERRRRAARSDAERRLVENLLAQWRDALGSLYAAPCTNRVAPDLLTLASPPLRTGPNAVAGRLTLTSAAQPRVLNAQTIAPTAARVPPADVPAPLRLELAQLAARILRETLAIHFESRSTCTAEAANSLPEAIVLGLSPVATNEAAWPEPIALARQVLAEVELPRERILLSAPEQADPAALLAEKAILVLTSPDVYARRAPYLDYALIALLRQEIAEGRLNARHPQLRERLAGYVAQYPFTPEAYAVFNLLLDASGGNTPRRRRDSLLAWAAAAEAGKFEPIMCYYAAYDLFRQKSYAQALEFARAYLVRHAPHHDRVHMLRALCLTQTGAVEEAQAEILKLIQDFPDSPLIPEALFLNAGVLFQNGQMPEAQTALQTLSRKYPKTTSGAKAAQVLADLAARE